MLAAFDGASPEDHLAASLRAVVIIREFGRRICRVVALRLGLPAAVPRGGHGCTAGLRWMRVPGTGEWWWQGNCREGCQMRGGSQVVGRG